MSEKKPNENITIYLTLALAVVLIIAILWLDQFNIPSHAIETPEFTSTTVPIYTFTATSTSIPNFAYTPTPFPTPILGIGAINLPANFRVGPWHDNSIKCDNDPKHYLVEVSGVKISGGTPPFEFTFWQGNRITKISDLYPTNEEIEFILPVILYKGEYVLIIINFQSASGESQWADNLYYHYLNDPSCTR